MDDIKIKLSKEDIEQIIDSLGYHYCMTECVEEDKNNNRIISEIEKQLPVM